MKLYKLAERDSTTYNGSMTWEIGKTNKVKKCKNPELCSGDVIHAYKNKNLALFLNPIHANIENMLMYECDGDIVVEDWGKCGVFKLTPTRKIKIPAWYQDEDCRKLCFVYFSILCAEASLANYENTYPGDTRPRSGIDAAKNYLNARSAELAARSAELAARSAVWSTAWSAGLVWSTAWSAGLAELAARSAWLAARSAVWSAESAENIDFCKIADKAAKYK